MSDNTNVDNVEQFSRNAKRQWSKLGDEQLKAIKGDSGRLIDAIKASYGMSGEEATKQVESWKKNSSGPNQPGNGDRIAKSETENTNHSISSKSSSNDNDNPRRM